MIPEKILWKVYAGALGAVTTIVSQKVVEGVWKYVTGDEETPQPDDGMGTHGKTLLDACLEPRHSQPPPPPGAA